VDAGKSVAVWDLAPDDLGPPTQFQAWSTLADQLIVSFPGRYRLVIDGDQAPDQRSDGKPIVQNSGECR
jgi:hypothetical protein